MIAGFLKSVLLWGGSYYADSAAHINYRQHGNNVTGLNGGVKGKIRQVKRYLNVFEIQKQCQNLLQCYGERMTPEYKKLTEMICNYDKSFGNWMNLLKCKEFDFKSFSLNGVVKLKIFLKKM